MIGIPPRTGAAALSKESCSSVFNLDSTAVKCDYCGATAGLADAASSPKHEKAGWASFRGRLPSTRHVCPGCTKGRKAAVSADRRLSEDRRPR